MPTATRILTSRTIKRSGRKPNSFRAVACDKLLGYPSKSQPFSWESGCSRRSFTIYKIRWLNEQYEMPWKEGKWGGGGDYTMPTMTTISFGTNCPFSMYSFARFPFSLPEAISALSRSPAAICTKPYCIYEDDLLNLFFPHQQLQIEKSSRKCFNFYQKNPHKTNGTQKPYPISKQNFKELSCLSK